MKIYEIKDMTTDELKKQIAEEESNLVDLRFAHQLKQLTNTGKLKLTKRDIARMKTVLKERELEGEVNNEEVNKEEEGANT